MYYKDPQNNIHALDSAVFEHMLPVGSVPITDAEARAIAAPIYVPTLAQNIAALTHKIKAEANKVTGDTIGELGNEYIKAKVDADAFKAAGYTGAVPSSVSSWATAKGWTATVACDDILTAAASWLMAQDSIRANRLARTEAAKLCTTQAALDGVAAQWSAFNAAIRSQLGV